MFFEKSFLKTVFLVVQRLFRVFVIRYIVLYFSSFVDKRENSIRIGQYSGRKVTFKPLKYKLYE